MGAITHNGEVLQRLPADASQINFDKTGTDLSATQTENAIKEVNTKVNANADDITQLKSGLTKQVSNSITLPATSNGITSTQIETSVPSGAHIIGGCISDISSYSDAVAMGVYYQGNYARVTCVSSVETTLPTITLNLITTYTV